MRLIAFELCIELIAFELDTHIFVGISRELVGIEDDTMVGWEAEEKYSTLSVSTKEVGD